MKILVTGSSGFIAGYLIAELLDAGHEVVGLDNDSKYGRMERAFDGHPGYRAVLGDAKDPAILSELLSDCDQFVAAAAIIGGISLFHELAYDLLAENERITAAAFDAAIAAHKRGTLEKITVVSSSMVYENCDVYPTPEGAQRISPPPHSTYGFQKLATEYFAQGAREQYGLPFTIVRPFNCIGIGEKRAKSDKEILSGNVKLAMSHVVPDLVQKGAERDRIRSTFWGDGPSGPALYLRRRPCPGHAYLAIESPDALNEDFNLSTAASTTVLELAELIWRKIKGHEPLRIVSDKPYTYDVQRRVPAVEKAKRLLGFEAKTTLSEALDEIIPWIAGQIEAGGI